MSSKSSTIDNKNVQDRNPPVVASKQEEQKASSGDHNRNVTNGPELMDKQHPMSSLVQVVKQGEEGDGRDEWGVVEACDEDDGLGREDACKQQLVETSYEQS